MCARVLGIIKAEAAHTIFSRKSFTLQCKMTSLPNCVVTLICADSSSKNGSWASVVSLTFSTFASVNGDESSCHEMSYGLLVSGTIREWDREHQFYDFSTTRNQLVVPAEWERVISISLSHTHIHTCGAFDNYLQSSSIWYWLCRKRQISTSHSTLRHLSSLNILTMQNYMFFPWYPSHMLHHTTLHNIFIVRSFGSWHFLYRILLSNKRQVFGESKC